MLSPFLFVSIEIALVGDATAYGAALVIAGVRRSSCNGLDDRNQNVKGGTHRCITSASAAQARSVSASESFHPSRTMSTAIFAFFPERVSRFYVSRMGA
jgi:hypothetical protein